MELIVGLVMGLFALFGAGKTVAQVAVAQSRGATVRAEANDLAAVRKQWADEVHLRPCIGARRAGDQCAEPDHVTAQ